MSNEFKQKTFQRVSLEHIVAKKLENSKLLGNFLQELPDDTNLDDIAISLKYSPKERKLEEWNKNPEGTITRQVTPLSLDNETREKVNQRLSGRKLSRTVDKAGRRILYVEK